MWEIGDSIVCIDDKNFNPKLFRIATPPKYGEIFTYEGLCPVSKAVGGILLAEYPETLTNSSGLTHRISFNKRRFVKLSDFLISGGVVRSTEKEKVEELSLLEI